MIGTKLIIDYRERDPNLWALSAMALPSQRNTRHISLFSRPSHRPIPYIICRAMPSERNARHISLFSCPSHRHQPSPGAQVQLLSSDTFHPQVMEREGTPPILPPLPKSSTSIFTETAFVAAENSASNLPQYCQYVPFQGRLSPAET